MGILSLPIGRQSSDIPSDLLRLGSTGLQGRLVCAEGIVTKASVVRPKWVKSVHYCPVTGKETTREYRCALGTAECRAPR